MSIALDLDTFQPFALFHAGEQLPLGQPAKIAGFDDAHYEINRNSSGLWEHVATISLSPGGFTIRTDASTQLIWSRTTLSTPMQVRADLVDGHFRVQFAAGREIVDPRVPETGTPTLTWASHRLAFSGGESTDDKGGPLILWPGKED